MDKKKKDNNEGNQGELVASEHEVRVAKVKALHDKGINPWPSYKTVSATCREALSEFSEETAETKEYTLAGRMLTKREHGKVIFANIQDRSGTLQIYLRQDALGDDAFSLVKHILDIGDIVWVRGPLFKTKMGEVTIKVQELTLLSKCLHPLPEKFHGLVDVEQRYRQRYLDLISNPESRERFKKRSRIIQAMRDFLLARDFLEVETPMLHPIPGGAVAKPFVTHHNAYDIDLYLRIAPELYLKRLVVGGLERVFEINRNFRNEGVSTKHNPEFTSLEYYMAHGDYHVGMDLTEKMIEDVVMKNCGTLNVPFGKHTLNFKAPYKRLSIEESLCEIGGFTKEQISKENIDRIFQEHELETPTKKPSYGEKLFFLFEEFVEPQIEQPVFITKHPIEVSPLARRDDENPYAVARFEFFACGMELANGFSELNDPFDQADRFKHQIELRQLGDQEAHEYDEDFVKALEYGLPPTVGVGIGVDRLVMLLTNTASIKDAILFPTMKPV